MIETKSQSTQTILHDYLLESLKLDFKDGRSDSNICETYSTIARVADKEYQQVSCEDILCYIEVIFFWTFLKQKLEAKR